MCPELRLLYCIFCHVSWACILYANSSDSKITTDYRVTTQQDYFGSQADTVCHIVDMSDDVLEHIRKRMIH